jgi:hypothetical protein
VTIYAISTNTSNTTTRGDKLMAKLAEETGGRAFFPLNIGDVAYAFDTIQEELRSQYALSYRPADFTLDGRYRLSRSPFPATKLFWFEREKAISRPLTDSAGQQSQEFSRAEG